MTQLANHLLPPNSTLLERQLLQTMAHGIALDTDIITGVKFDAPDEWLDALIFEYGLAELSPYITDKRQLIKDGIAWQRIRGTPQSLHNALSWINVTTAIKEPPPSNELDVELAAIDYIPHKHFAEYDLHPHELPNSQQICQIVHLALLAQPKRSRLWRLIFDYDRSVLRLDEGTLDDELLDDDSGIRPTRAQLPCLPSLDVLDVIPKLSFKLQHGSHIIRNTAAIDAAITINHATQTNSWTAHMPYLDDLPDPFEVLSISTSSASSKAAAVYYGQIWADRPWSSTDTTWNKTNVIVTGSHN